MSRAFFHADIKTFLIQDTNSIVGEMGKQIGTLEDTQRDAWHEEIRILKNALNAYQEGHLVLEYTIPRVGKRIDAVFILHGLIFLIEFKVDSNRFEKHAIDQVTDYALDLKNFHKASHDALLIPILLATNAPAQALRNQMMKPGILEVNKCNHQTLNHVISVISQSYQAQTLDALTWINSPYAPTPTIIEAAQALYGGHGVKDISRNDASAVNLNQTTSAINQIIDKSKLEKRKSICFITGVPGAGKTLAGLNIANERHQFEQEEHAVFLSGNQPLVEVLQESLARDEHARLKVKKTEALAKVKSFIQMIHHFRDDALDTKEPPIEKVAIFDEAQRAWTKDMLANFMKRKKGRLHFNQSEPEFLIEVMDRHQDWAVIICLIGGGQEINTGEAGLIEWFSTLRKHYSSWDVYVSNQITDTEYIQDTSLDQLLGNLNYQFVSQLHLGVSLRSFRSENVARFVKAILDLNLKSAQNLYPEIHKDYPIYLGPAENP